MPAVTEVVDFLRRYPPFDTLGEEELATVAELTEIAFYPSGRTVFVQGEAPPAYFCVVRSGSVELIYDGQLLDLLGEGELFGQGSLMSGLPVGFSARVAEDTLLYQVPTEAMAPLLARPRAMRFLLRSVIVDPIPGAGDRPPTVDPLQRRTSSLLRMPLVVCDPNETVVTAARAMTERNAKAAIVVDTSGTLGIVTDADLRSKVLAVGRDPGVPVREVMTTPVRTVGADQPGGDALVEMVEAGVRHLPVIGVNGMVLEDPRGPRSRVDADPHAFRPEAPDQEGQDGRGRRGGGRRPAPRRRCAPEGRGRSGPDQRGLVGRDGCPHS
jgi:CBS domain-containing protein